MHLIRVNINIRIYYLHKLLLMKDQSWFYLIRMGVDGKDKTKSYSIYFVVDNLNNYVEYVNFRKVFTDV